MTEKTVRKQILRIVKKISRDYQPDQIILFGSYAYGSPTRESDIDLLIIKDTTKRRIDRFCEVRKMIRDIKGISVQPVIFTSHEIKNKLNIGDDFIKEVLKEGKVLYEKQQGKSRRMV